MCTKRLSAVAVCLLLLGMSSPAMAQAPLPVATTDRGTVGLGVTGLHENYGTGKGGEIDVQVADFRSASPVRIGLVVGWSFNRFDGFTETTVLGGVRFAARSSARIRPFGQLLVGVERCGKCKTNDPTVEPAAGVDVALTRGGRVGIRAEAGYRFTPSAGRNFKETHILIGISVRSK